MPKRKNKIKYRHAEPRNTKKTRKGIKNPPVQSEGDTSGNETLQDIINKRTENTKNSLPRKITPLLPSTTPIASLFSDSLKKIDHIIDKQQTNYVEEFPRSSPSPSIISKKNIADTSFDQKNNYNGFNETETDKTTKEVAHEIYTNSVDEPVAAPEKQTVITTSHITYDDNVFQPNSVSKSLLPNMSTTEILSGPVIVVENNIVVKDNIPLHAESFDNKEIPPIHPIQVSSASTRDIVLRSSHDPKNNIIVEDVDLDAIYIEQSLDTSTPLASPSISTIMQNIDAENLSFSNINTPTSSLCVSSSVNDETFTLSLCGGDTTEVSDVETTQAKRTRITKKKTTLGRIRKAKRNEWLDNQRKQLKNLGLNYTSRGGKERPAKSMLSGCDYKCRLKCKEKIEENVRKQLFTRFWSLGNRVRQWGLLSRWCERVGKKRITTEGPSKRFFSIRYYLPITVGNNKEERVLVCKKMFLHTFAIGEGVVRTALNKIADGDGLIVESDMRGHHDNHPKVKNKEMINSVCEHVKSFTPVEAHYTRKESSKLYLDSDLTLSKMFKLYEEWVTSSDPNRAKTLRQYTDIINENFNIEFHRPKKDQCDECISYKNLPKPINQDDQKRFDEHLRNKELARSLKNVDKLSALRSPGTTITAAFDFQKVHSAPHAETSILYYKRKLNIYNFTIFEMGQKVGKCYMWHEGTAKRGANEVASCVYDFIKEQSSKGIRTINLYSDNCGGQNKNKIVFMMYLLAAKEFKVDITHRFLEKGHTQNENDSIHALIERCAKHKEIYTPDQWFALVRWAKESGSPYIVKEVATEDILDFKKLLSGKNFTKNEKNQKIMWTKIRELKVSSSESDVIYYKNQFNENYQRLIVCRTQNLRRQNQTIEELTQAYTGPLPIPHAKVADLKYLCEHNVIPRQYHSFFNSLVPGNEELGSDED